MTVLGDANSPSSFDYALDVPEGTSSQTSRDGSLSLYDQEGRSLGQVGAAWARDANGMSLPTHYEWADGILTQHVDLTSPEIVFPVVADPAWSYSVGWMIETRTVQQVRAKLYSCFNCYFPVAGAPHNFPVYNQFLPLEVGPIPGTFAMNFNCYFDWVDYWQYDGDAWFEYEFSAAPGHIDGLGSIIVFQFHPAWSASNPSNRYTELTVNATIMNDNPGGLGRPAYTAGAWYTWGAFAGNLRTG